mmetsp:Transcript_160689/g.390342  ORF Transcript_160689/g.390342 Transcript_160689/m.390342 type:complete len:229 (-) Transcript_160689:13-699(-)
MQNIERIGARVHQIHLGEHANCAGALRIDLERHLERIRVGDVSVRRSHGKDHRRGVRDVLAAHRTNLCLDICGLISHRHLGDARQVNHRQVQHMGRVDLQVDGLLRDALVAPGRALRLALDLRADFGKISKARSRQVREFAPLLALNVGGQGLVLLRRSIAGNVEQLQHQGPPRHHAHSTRQEIAADDGLEHAALAARLRADDHDLREVDRRRPDGVEHILQLIHNGN